MRKFEIAIGYEKLVLDLPKRSTKNSAGYDFTIIEDLVLKPHSIGYAKTGIKAKMNEDEVLYLYARSSLAKKYGVLLPNSVGVIDSDYYGNTDNDGAIFIQLYNFKEQEVLLKRGERIAQGVFSKFLKVDFEETIEKEREGGFGSTSE